MGVLGKIFGGRRAKTGDLAPRQPVEVNAPGEGVSDGVIAAGRSLGRHEAMAELQRNYNEVITLVRKVDAHLDKADMRSQRLVDLAERTASSLEALPSLRDQQSELNETVGRLLEATRESQHRHEAALQRQNAAFDDVRRIAEHAEAGQQRLSGALDQFSGSMTSVGDATGRLGDAIASLRQTDLDREAELVRMVARSNRVMMACMGGVALMVIVTLVVVAMTVTSSGG
jgi:hypothetical protein